MKDKLRLLAISCRRSAAATILMSCALAALWIWTLVGSNRMLQAAEGPKNERIQPPPGMAWIPGGEFTMGTDDVHSLRHCAVHARHRPLGPACEN
jgi:hypothetical protein